MKNFKFLSSLALAGMLTTGFMGTSLAAKTDVPTQPLGIYKKLVASKTVVPFILANRDDVVTIKDIKDSGKFKDITSFKGIAVPAEDTVVSTGDVFQADGVEYTVIVYGDVTKDGQFDINDVTTAAKAAVKLETLDDVQSEVADVINDGKLTVADVTHLAKYSVGLETNLVKDPPPAEPAEEVKQNVTVELKDKYINNFNKGKIDATIKIAEQFKAPVKITKIQILGEDGKPLSNSIDLSDPNKTITINAHTSQMDVEDLDLSSTYIPEGKETTLQLVSEDGEVIATFTVGKHTTTKVDAKVTTNRSGSQKATVSAEAFGNAKVTKMHYMILKQPTAGTAVTSGAPETREEILAKKTSVALTDNKVTEAALSGIQFEAGEAYELFYVLEDEYGNIQTDVNPSVIITVDGKLGDSAVIDTVEAPDLTKTVLSSANFTVTLKDNAQFTGKKFTVTLYKDGKVVYSKPGSTIPSSGLIAASSLTDTEGNVVMGLAGTYVLEVSVDGNYNTNPSAAVKSTEVKVTQLEQPTDVNFVIDKSANKKITWNSSYSKDDVKDITVEVYEINQDGNKTGGNVLTSGSPVAGDVRQLVLKDAAQGGNITLTSTEYYKAYVKIEAKANQSAVIDSKVAESKAFFIIDGATISVASTTTNSMRLNIDSSLPIVNDKTTKYKVEIYKVNDEANTDKTQALYYDGKTIDVELKKDGRQYYVVVDGLEPGVKYAASLIAEVGDVQGRSVFVEGTTKKAMPEINELPVSTSAANANNIAVIGGNLYVKGQLYDTLSDYPADLTNVKNIVAKLQDGDKITYSSEKLTIDFESRANDDVDLGTVTGMKIELIGDGFLRNISATGAKEIVLSGDKEDALFDITSINSGVAEANQALVRLNNLANVTADADNGQKVTLSAGNTATINGVKVKASAETKIQVGKPEVDDSDLDPNTTVLKIAANEATNNLEFTTSPESKGVGVEFVGKDGFGSKQEGNILITATGGTVKVYSDSMNVGSNVTIDATDAEKVTVNGAELAGAKTVNVKTTAKEQGASAAVTTITAKSKMAAPVSMKDAELRTYSDEELLGGGTPSNGKIKDADQNNPVTSENIKQVRDYLAQFGVLDVKGEKVGREDTYIKVTATKGSNEVTITLPSGVSSQTIKNLN